MRERAQGAGCAGSTLVGQGGNNASRAMVYVPVYGAIGEISYTKRRLTERPDERLSVLGAGMDTRQRAGARDYPMIPVPWPPSAATRAANGRGHFRHLVRLPV